MIRVTFLDRGEVRTLVLDEGVIDGFKENLVSRGGRFLAIRSLNPTSWKSIKLSSRRPSPEAWAPWFSAVSRSLKGGIPLDQCLDLLADAAPVPAEVWKIHRAVISGQRFSDALDPVSLGLPDLIPALIRSGEASGDLARGAELAHQTLIDLVSFRRELRARLAYPIVVMGSAGIGLLVLLLKVFPAISGMWTSLGKPPPGKFLIIQVLGWTGVLFLSATAIALSWMIGNTQKAQLVPGFRGIGRHRERSEAWSALSMGLSGGVPLVEALALLGERWGADEIARRIQGGVRPEEALVLWVNDSAGLRAVFMASLRVGDLASGARQVAEGYRDLLHQDLQRIQQWLEPSILILLGTIILGLAWSLFSVLGEMEHGLVH